jgi:23S rRNA pseudouridine2604 synthase
MPKNAAESVSLNKYISDTGFCSRRDADDYIEKGRVTINGKPARTGNRIGAGDLVEIDGEPVGRKRAAVYLAYNKPVGVTSTTDLKDRTNIVSAIDFKERIFPVGRLDKDSEGLIFLTNDGSIVNRILRAGNAHEKEYVVGVDKPLTPEFVKAMSSGVRIDGETTLPCKVVQEGKNGFRITLVQGLNRQIRRMCHALGFEVTRLRRVRIMNMHLGNLPVGHWRYFNAEETETLQRMIQGSSDDAAASPARKKASPRKAVPNPKPIAPDGETARPKSRTAQEYREERKAKTEAIKKKSREANKAGDAAKAAGKRPGAPGGKTAPAAGRRGAAKSGSFKDFRSKRGKKG